MTRHIKEFEFKKGSYIYMLEVDSEDKTNMRIESVTIIDGPIAGDLDLDPEEFQEDLDDDDWSRISETLTQMGVK